MNAAKFIEKIFVDALERLVDVQTRRTMHGVHAWFSKALTDVRFQLTGN